jgi:hypothetical protein
MKKILLSFVVSLLAFVSVPALALAATPAQITGNVIINGQAKSGATVIVICNGHAIKTHTNNAGTYSVVFTAKQCPVGSNVTVTAKKGNKGGESSNTVHGATTTVNVNVVTTTQVPELGTITSVGALVAASGAFMIVRKRQSAQV